MERLTLDEMFEEELREVPSWHDPYFDDNLDGTRNDLRHVYCNCTRNFNENDVLELLEAMDGDDGAEELW